MFSEALRSSGNTARETPNPSDLPMDFRLSDPFLIPFLKDFEEVGIGRVGRVVLIPSNPYLFIGIDNDLESKSFKLQMGNCRIYAQNYHH